MRNVPANVQDRDPYDLPLLVVVPGKDRLTEIDGRRCRLRGPGAWPKRPPSSAVIFD